MVMWILSHQSDITSHSLKTRRGVLYAASHSDGVVSASSQQNGARSSVEESGRGARLQRDLREQVNIKNAKFATIFSIFTDLVLRNTVLTRVMRKVRTKVFLARTITIGKGASQQRIKYSVNRGNIGNGERRYFLEMISLVKYVVSAVRDLRRITYAHGQIIQSIVLGSLMEELYV